MKKRDHYRDRGLSRRDYGTPLSVYRARSTLVVFAFLGMFCWACGQTGGLLRTVAAFPAARTDLWLAWLWVMATGLAVIWITWLFWEPTYLRFLGRPLGVGLQMACGGWWGWSSWQLPLPGAYSPLSPLLSIPLALVGIWGALAGICAFLLLAWDFRRGPTSRRLKGRGERTPWDGSLDFSLMTGGLGAFVDRILDAYYDLRETIDRDAQP
jgi:hypothetical protein